MAVRKLGIVKVLGIIVAVLVIAAVAIPFIIDVNQFRPQIESRLTGALGRGIALGNLKLSLLSGDLEVDDISISDNPVFSRSPFVTARLLKVSVELMPLIFSKEIRITGISLDGPEITLICDAAGRWNFSDLGAHAASGAAVADKPAGASGEAVAAPAGDAPADFLIRRFTLTDGKVRIIKGERKPSVYEKVDITAGNLSFATSFPLSLSATLPGGGTLALEGKAGPLNRSDMLATPLEADLTVAQLDLVASGFTPPGAGLAGIFDFKSTITSDGSRVKSRGHATAVKLQVMKSGAPADKPVSLDYLVTYDLAKRDGTVQDSRIGVGKAVASLSGNYEMRGNDLYMEMKLHGSNMPVDDLAGLLPAFAVTLPKGASLHGGVLNVGLAAEGPVEKLVMGGTAEIDKTRLVGFDLSGKLAAVTQLLVGIGSKQETGIEKFTSTMRMTPDGIRISGLLLEVPAFGKLSGEGNISAEQALNFTMQAVLSPSGGVASALARFTKGVPVPFFIRGTASDPKFVPDTKNAARSLLGSALSGKSSGEGQTGKGDSLNDVLRNLLKKKK